MRELLRGRARCSPMVALLAWVIVAGGIMLPGVGAEAAGFDDPAASAQQMLDRVLGPGNALVEVNQRVSSGDRSAHSVQWGAATSAAVSTDRLVTANGSASSSAVLNDVAGSETTLNTPAGTVLQQSATVVVDRTAMGRTTVKQLRLLVGNAVGLRASRGDRLLVLVTRVPKPTPVSVPTPSWTAVLLPFAVPLMIGLGGVLALLIVIAAVRRPGRRGRDLRPS